jgi:alpha-tubulin suppressor-like RCC1 family protein
MCPLIPDLQRELGEYLSIEELEYLLVNNSDIDLEYEVISDNKWWRYLAISKYNFTSSELDSFKETHIFKALLPLLLNNNKITAGARHSLALDNQGKLYAWGSNDLGQLGLDDYKDRTIPTLIKSELTFKAIATGPHHSLALDTKGKLYVWGENNYGQLGLGDYKDRAIPTLIKLELTFRTIEAGTYHSLALDNKGKLYAWGNNDTGQLGLSDEVKRNIPTLIKSELTFRTIAAGYQYSLALDNRGKLYAWGKNDEGQLGLGDRGKGKNRTIPTLIKSELTFKTIAAGDFHSLALDTKGKLYAWGYNQYGQLGLGDEEERNIPTLIKSELTFRTIAAGAYHSLSLDKNGKLYAWGRNNKGQLGLGDNVLSTNRTIPTLIKSELTVRTIAAGTGHSISLDTSGKLYTLG